MADDAAEAGLVDIHTHVQPSASAGRTFLGRLFLDDHPLVGTVDELLAVMDEAAISRTVIVPWLPAHDLVDEAVAAGTDRDQAVDDVVSSWRELNRWATEAVQAHPGRLRCLVGLDPILMSEEVMAEEVDERLAAGAGGLKVAPMFLGIRPDDPAMEVVWRLARQHDVYVLSECGALPYTHHGAWGHPDGFDEVLRSYPDVDVLLAHLGQGAEDRVARLTERHGNVFTDTSLRLGGPEQGGWSPEDTVEVIRRIGVDRVLFGTNYPIVDPRAYAATLRSLPLDEDELDLIGRRNAERLLDRRSVPSV
jgi:predicted TIM-barrel fold metal-dependent hydrolase